MILFSEIFPVLSVLQEFCILLFGRAQGRVRTPQNRTEIRINTAQNKIRKPQTVWFCKTAIPQLKLKVPAKPHQKSSKTAGYRTCDLRLFAHSPPSPKKLRKGVVDCSTDRPFTHLALSINLISTFCNQFQLSALKNFNFLDCLGLIDALSANERAEIIACILLVYQLLGTSKSLKRSEKLESKIRRLKEALLYYKRNVNHCHRPYGPTRDHSYVDTLVCRDDCKQSTHYHIRICCFQN